MVVWRCFIVGEWVCVVLVIVMCLIFSFWGGESDFEGFWGVSSYEEGFGY